MLFLVFCCKGMGFVWVGLEDGLMVWWWRCKLAFCELVFLCLGGFDMDVV